MAYDSTQLVKDTRMYLGSVGETALPDDTITFFGTLHDNNPSYTDQYYYILWKTTLSCIEWLMAAQTTSSTSSSAKFSRTEKVGEVTVTTTEDNSSGSSSSSALEDLYDLYVDSPEKFGITIVASSGATGAVIISGTGTYPNLGIATSGIARLRGTSVYSRKY